MQQIAQDSSFVHEKPTKWFNIENLILQDSYEELLLNPIPVEMFDEGYLNISLNCKKEVYKKLPNVWRYFIEELKSEDEDFSYKSFASIFCKFRKIELEWEIFHGEVSEIINESPKTFCHVFYLNKNDHWNDSWNGGEYLLTNPTREQPTSFRQFISRKRLSSFDNHSFFYLPEKGLWRGIPLMNTPEGVYKRTFIIAGY
jgi:hypothetical protein